MKVTVAIAVYNVEKYIEKCVNSALNQDFEGEYEVLVVDDCGKDNSISIVEQIAATHPNGGRIRIVHHEQNIGTGAARNTSINEAKGEYICFMDGDDYMAPNAVRLLYEAMLSNSADIVMGNHQRVYPDGNMGGASNYRPGIVKSDYALAQWMKEKNTNYYPVATWNKLFRISFLRDNCICCVPWHRQEDIFFALQTAFFTKTIVTIPEVTYNWAVVNGSCTNSEVTEWHLNQYIDILNRCLSLCKEKEKEKPEKFSKEIYWIITNRFLYGFITQNTIKSSLLSKKQKKEYIGHLKEITHYIKRHDEYNWKQKAVYTIVKMPCPYHLMKLFAFGLGMVRAMKTKFRRVFLITEYPTWN